MADRKVLFRLENLTKHFPIKKQSLFQKEQLAVRANEDITIDIWSVNRVAANRPSDGLFCGSIR